MSFLNKRRAGTTPHEPVFPLNGNVKVHASFTMGQYRNLQIQPAAKVNIAESVLFREFCNILVNDKASLLIRKGVFFNNYCSINCLDHIEIGEDTIFGEGGKLYDHNHKYAVDPFRVEKGEFTTAPIRIGKNCWIGSNVTILKGVTIGDNVIIGAGCLIVKSIPSNSLVKHIENLDIRPL